ITGEYVIHDETLAILNEYLVEWRKLNPKAEVPIKFIFTPSSPLWSLFESTPFFKVVKWTFHGTGKTIRSIHVTRREKTFWERPVSPFNGATMSCKVE
ncbi:hypothetical protein LY78DRAFT_538102, partial [Colletotrichum sublineola]